MNTSDKELLWKQYQLEVDLYKFYFDQTVKFNVFYYAATGAILSFYFTTQSQSPFIRYALLFPAIISLGFGAVFIYGAVKLRVMRQDVLDLRDKLGLETAPDLHVLTILLLVSATIMLFVGGLLLWYFRQ